MAFTMKGELKTEMIFFIAFYLLICTFIIALSPTVLLYVGHDMSPVLDGAWRIENHQLPHNDFPSILGYGYLLQQYIFLTLFHYNFIAFAVSSVVITSVVFLIFLSFYSSAVFISNTSRPFRIYLLLLLMSLGLGQYHFGETHTLLTYANLYNRYSFLCLFALFIQFLLLKNARPNDIRLIIRLVVAALLLNYLLFVKLTYFVVAIGLLTMCLTIALVSLKIYLRLLLITMLIFIAVTLVSHVNFLSVLHDYQTISAARGKVLVQPAFIKHKLFQYYNIAFLVSLLILVIDMLRRRIAIKFVLLIGFTGVCAVLIQFTNWGATDIVLLSFVPMVFILLPAFRRTLSFRLFMLLCCFFIFKNFRSIYYLTKAKGTAYTELKSPYLSGFYTDFKEIHCNEDYAPWVMSGVALTDKNKRVGETVFAFSFDNPYPFLTHTVPPENVSPVWQFATTYSYEVYPKAEVLFSDVDLILMPTCKEAESTTEMMKLYGAIVDTHYVAVDSNANWRLYRKIKPM